MQTIIESQSNKQTPYKKIAIGLFVVISAISIASYTFSSPATINQLDVNDLHIGTVKSGTLVQDIRAPGNLVAKNRQWLSAQSSAKVSKRLLEPGAKVSPDSIIMQLSSPDLIQEYKREQIQFEVVNAQLAALKEVQTTEQQKLKADVSLLEIEKQQAIEDALAKKKLHLTKIIPDYQYKEALLREQKLTLELEIARFELAQLPRLQASLLKVEQAKVEQQNLQVSLLHEQVERLNVRAGMHGILQSIAVEEGQEVSKGMELARVAQQSNLKAELRVQESQAKDIKIGQTVIIDTRRSKISGLVSRIDPAVFNGTVTIDIDLPDPLPPEARPDLRVNGTIEIQRLENVLLLDKPSNWQASSITYLYKLTSDDLAVKTKISLGASSTVAIQLLAGLTEGEQVILSDLADFTEHEQLIINN